MVLSRLLRTSSRRSCLLIAVHRNRSTRQLEKLSSRASSVRTSLRLHIGFLPYQQLTFLQFYQTVSILRLSYTIRHTVSWEYVIQITEPAEKVSETVKSAVGGATAQASQKAEELKHDAKGAANEAGYNADSLSAQASQKAGELKEDVKGSATNAGHTAEQVKLEAQKKANNRKHSIQARFGMFTSTSTVIEC